MSTADATATELHEYVLRMGMMDDDASSEFISLFGQSLLRKHLHAVLSANPKTDLAAALEGLDSPELIDWAAVRPPSAVHPDPVALARARSGSHGEDLSEAAASAEHAASSAGGASATSGAETPSSGAAAAAAGMLMRRDGLYRCPSDNSLRQELLRKVAVVKLNGGLGTRMGCWGPKSALEVREGLTFLDLVVKQIEALNMTYNADVPLVLMNSFQTHDDTVRVLGKYARHDITVHCIIQSCFPRLDQATMLPMPDAPFGAGNRALWYPPGHGDVWRALTRSGMLAELIREGREWLFVSNVDNLGATVDLRILHSLAAGELEARGCDFAMEVTPKTKQDRQGGVFVDYHGRPMLVETGQAPVHMRPELESLRTFNKHNTNNLWASAKRVQELVESSRMQSQVLIQRREVDGLCAVQLETAAGAAIRCFESAVGVEVDRSRFLPVKSTSDLLAVQSNLFEIRHGALLPSPLRQVPSPPVVRLGPEFARLRDYAVRFAAGLPDVVELDHLTVSGNVVFARNVTLRGTVIIVANEGSRIDIPEGSVLENKVVTGNMRILDN
jgi:UTP--glucose-1-phosphate uridylyltransferase